MSATEFHKFGQHVQVSQEVLDDALALAEAWRGYQTATPEQREQWQREAKAKRAAERQSAPVVAMTLNNLIGKLGWTDAYANHYIQAYCYCGDGQDGWDYCQHAYDEGVR